MAVHISTALRNFLAAGGSYAQAMQNGRMEIYTGTQPGSADEEATGTLLCVITSGGLTHTPESRATGQIIVNDLTNDQVSAPTVNGVSIEALAGLFTGGYSAKAGALAASINKGIGPLRYTATTTSTVISSTTYGVVNLKAPIGLGARANTWVVAASGAGVYDTTDMAGGVTAVNGLRYVQGTRGLILKDPDQSWFGTNLASGLAGWFRLYGAGLDAGGDDVNGVYLREDGAIATSGSQLNMQQLVFAAGASTGLPTFSRAIQAI